MTFVSFWIWFPIKKWRTDSGSAIKQMKDCLPAAANSIVPYSLLEENPENPRVTHRRIWPSVKDLCLEYQHWLMLQNHIWFIKTTNELIIKISKYFPLLLHQTVFLLFHSCFHSEFSVFWQLLVNLPIMCVFCLDFLKRIISKWKEVHFISLWNLRNL